MDEIEYTEEEAKKAWENWLINFIKTEPEIHKLIEWIGDNQVRYDGVKLWKRKWEGNTACYAYKDRVEELYNTKQLIEQYFKEKT